jgi:hypothetical protein
VKKRYQHWLRDRVREYLFDMRSDEDFASLIGSVGLMRRIRRDGVDKSKESWALNVFVIDLSDNSCPSAKSKP